MIGLNTNGLGTARSLEETVEQQAEIIEQQSRLIAGLRRGREQDARTLQALGALATRLSTKRAAATEALEQIAAAAPELEPQRPARIMTPDDAGKYGYQLGHYEAAVIARAALAKIGGGE